MSRNEVVIVGAGAAGLTAAITLARAGVAVRVIEKLSEGSPRPRATVLSLRTMELMRSWGLEQDVLGVADDVEMTMLEVPTMVRSGEGRRIDVGYPTGQQSAIVSPTQAACVAQDLFETVLRHHLATFASATVERGATVLGVELADNGVLVAVRDRDGVERHIEAAYVIGADGAHSIVRRALGLQLVGADDLMSGVQVEFRAPLWDVVRERRHLIYVTSALGSEGVLIPAGLGDRWLFGSEYFDDPGRDWTIDDVRHRLLAAIGDDGVDVRIERYGRFTSGAQLATAFSRGRCYLAGDAAHRVTPRGGTGLNIAVADGADLGWKLAWVMRGWAPESFLANYERERRPAVAHNVMRSSDPMGSRRSAATELAVDLGGRIRHAWLTPVETSTIDVLGPGLTLLVSAARSPWSAAVAACGGPMPVELVDADALVARALGISDGGALLVRPDGVPIAQWWATRDTATALRAAIRAFVRGETDSIDDQDAA